MKIAVSAKGDKLSSEVDPRFGRAAYFIIYNIEDDSFEAISNENNAQAVQGAGVQAAQTVADKGVKWVISGNMGPKAFAGLKAAGIKFAAIEKGTVEEAIKLIKENKLQEVSEANTRGHWQ
jgi:predicted Fe-Mo cluster-binding NifX family protein